MDIIDKKIDGGKAFDWGKTSVDYTKYRDIYPQIFYDKILSRNLCLNGQNVLDIGTGTGVIPRNMYRYGAKWIGTDISENQIEQAKFLSKDMDIAYYTSPTETINFPANSFDVITACQCFWYFNHEQVMPILHRILKADGRMKACRGVGASLTQSEIVNWEQEHKTLLEKIAPDEFDILHYAAIAELKKK